MPSSYIRRAEKNLLELTVAGVFLIVLGALGVSATVLDAGKSGSGGLVAEYRFDTGAGNTAYDTAGDNDGTINGAKWTSGVEGKALEFDGDDNVALSSSSSLPSGSEAFTISTWVKIPSSCSNPRGVFGYGNWGSNDQTNALRTGNNCDGMRHYFWSNDLSTGDISINDNQWHHVAVTYNGGSSRKIFLDGRLEASDNPGPVNMQVQNVNIGVTNNNEYFNGKIDGLKIYSTNLSKSQILSIYNSGSWRIGTATSNDDPSKVLDISFQHQNSSHVLDTSRYNNHGEIYGNAKQEDAVSCKVGRCYGFDGSSGTGVDLNDIWSDHTQSRTFMFWFKEAESGAQDDDRIITQDCSEWFCLTDNGKNSIVTGVDGYSSAPSYSLDQSKWHHASLVFNESNSVFTFYLNGENKTSIDYSSGWSHGTRPVVLAGNTEGPDDISGNQWEGKIDNLKIFNRSLPQAEIIDKTQKLEGGGTVLDLRFNRNGGDKAQDYSGEKNHGTLQPNSSAGPKWVDGLTGNALKFDGSQDYVDISSSSSAYDSDATTVIAWVKPDTGGWIAGDGGRHRLALDTNEATWWVENSATGNNNQISGGNPKPDSWNLVVGTYDADTGRQKLYLNGELVASAKPDIGFTSGDDNQIVGGSYGNNADFDGIIDNLKFYPYAISQSKVQQLYNQGKSQVGSSSSSSSTDLQDGLVLSQSFNRIETCGQSDTISCPSGMNGKVAVDESGEANHGELVNGPTEKGAEDCRVGGCLGFDGSDDDVVVPNSPSLNVSKLTLSAWIKADSSMNAGSLQDFMGKGGDWKLLDWTTDKINFYITNSTTSYHRVNAQYDTGEWEHVLATYDGSNMALYINGEKKNINSIGDPLKISTSDFTVGEGQFNGSIDQVRVYNRSLSKEEVWKLYTRGRDRSTSSNGPMKHFTGSSSLQSVTDRVGEDGTLGSNTSRETSDPDVTSGYVTTGLEFSDANNEYVEKDNPVDPTEDSESMSVSFWLKPDSGTGNNALVEWNGGAHIWQYNSEDDFFFNPTGTCSSRKADGAVKLDQWAHYTVLYDAPENEFRWYVDGKLVKSATESCQIDTSSDKLRLGKRVGSNDGLDGKLDEVKIFPYALSEKQIREEASAGVKTEKTDYNMPRSCREIHASKQTDVSSVYSIDPDGKSGAPPFPVFCEMEENGGGWTKLNFLPDSHLGRKGAPFGGYRYTEFSFGESHDPRQGNLGLSFSSFDPVDNEAFFQRDSNQRCTKYAVGNATRDSFQGVATGWDYYDAKGRPIPVSQVQALNSLTREGTYYNGGVTVGDIDGPFPNGGDGDGGENSFSIPVDSSATHSPTGGGPIALWFSTEPDLDAGTTHVLGSDHDSREGRPVFEADWKPVNTQGVPMFFGGKVDNDANLYSKFSDSDTDDCERQAGSEFELENQFFYAK